VVDTIGLNDKTFVNNFRTLHTDKLYVVERKLVKGSKTMQVDITFDDADAFNAPWSVMQIYHRIQRQICADVRLTRRTTTASDSPSGAHRDRCAGPAGRSNISLPLRWRSAQNRAAGSIQVIAGNAGRPAGRVRRKGDLSSQDLRIVLLHALHHPGLENGGFYGVCVSPSRAEGSEPVAEAPSSSCRIRLLSPAQASC
jgi:hypothetical protein